MDCPGRGVGGRQVYFNTCPNSFILSKYLQRFFWIILLMFINYDYMYGSYKKRYGSKYYSKNRKTYKKKSSYKKTYSSAMFPRQPKVMTVSGNLPLPPVMKTKFYLTTKGSMTINAGVQSNITITGNSLFDPFSTFGSNQPQMFDELSNF